MTQATFVLLRQKEVGSCVEMFQPPCVADCISYVIHHKMVSLRKIIQGPLGIHVYA